MGVKNFTERELVTTGSVSYRSREGEKWQLRRKRNVKFEHFTKKYIHNCAA